MNLDHGILSVSLFIYKSLFKFRFKDNKLYLFMRQFNGQKLIFTPPMILIPCIGYP